MTALPSHDHLQPAMTRKRLAYAMRMSVVLLKNFRLTGPEGGLARHHLHGGREGYTETFPYNEPPVRRQGPDANKDLLPSMVNRRRNVHMRFSGIL
jgi:hypothetical protein